MSIRALTEITEDLPHTIANDVMGYARSVQSAIPEIFRDARIREDRDLGDQLVFLAGIKKLYSLISSQYWTLDNSLHLMEQDDVSVVRIGSTEISRGSDYHRRLRVAVREFERLLADANMTELIEIRSYSELAQRLRHER